MTSALALDLAHAQDIQRSFMPVLPASIPGVELAAEYAPVQAVGGDFYDVFTAPSGDQLLVVIGDVAGHGVSGALWMSRATLDLRRLGRRVRSPRGLLTGLHRKLAPIMPDDLFVTALCASIEPRLGRLRVANAGHSPVLIRRASGQLETIGGGAGAPIPFLARPNYTEVTTGLAPGDVVLFTTDGVTDALRTEDDPLGTQALGRIIRRVRRFDRILPSILEATSHHPVRDDRTLIACRLVDDG
jgi:sigma-B regulation protein RsbU (phosphoserine phosphatase)